MYNNKANVIQRLNGCTPFDQIVPQGTIEEAKATMPVELVLASIVKAHGLKPGADCAIRDYVVTPDGITVMFHKGKFAKSRLVSPAIAELFTDGQAEPTFDGE
jgi:hypothetical protein